MERYTTRFAADPRLRVLALVVVLAVLGLIYLASTFRFCEGPNCYGVQDRRFWSTAGLKIAFVVGTYSPALIIGGIAGWLSFSKAVWWKTTLGVAVPILLLQLGGAFVFKEVPVSQAVVPSAPVQLTDKQRAAGWMDFDELMERDKKNPR